MHAAGEKSGTTNDPSGLAARSNSSDIQVSFGDVARNCCVVPGMAVWACERVFGGGTSDAMGVGVNSVGKN